LEALNVSEAIQEFDELPMALVLIMIVYFIHYFINGFQLKNILHWTGENSWRAVQALKALNVSGKVQEFGELSKVPQMLSRCW
jgi:hypothetical protein